MNIYAEEGTKVVAWNTTSGYNSDKERFKRYFNKGEIYTVDYTEVGGWHTNVYLKEYPNVAFNSVQFEDLEGFEHEDQLIYPTDSEIVEEELEDEDFGGDTMSDVIDKAIIVKETKDHFFKKGEVVEFIRRHPKSGSYVFKNARQLEQYLVPEEFEWLIKE
jgi:hypothetical protein